MKKRRKFLVSILVVALSLCFAYTLIGQQKVLSERQKQLDGIMAKIEAENSTREDLLEQKDILNSDEYIEKVAREQLGYVKRGERVFVDINR